MARIERDAPVPTALVPLLLRFARRRGVWTAELTARFDLPADAPTLPLVAIAPSSLRRLFEAVADATFEPALGLRLAEEPVPSLTAMNPSRTVHPALLSWIPRAAEVHPHAAFQLVPDVEGARWFLTSTTEPRGLGPHGDDYTLAFVLARCREACRVHPLRASSVWLAHARPRDVGPLHLFFGTQQIVFGAETSGFALSRDALDAPLEPSASKDTSAPSRPTVRSTAALAAATLPSLLPDRATLDDTARALAVSPRTLQRRLEEDGTTFLEVLERVREESARALLLESDAPLADIGERLGFSDLAGFSRAFKRWTGQPPGMYRRRARRP